MASLATTAVAMSGGVDGTAGVGKKYRIEVTTDLAGNWATGDTILISLLATLTGRTVEAGFGSVSGLAPTFVFIFKDKVYLLIGTVLFYSDVAKPTSLNDINGVGNSFIEMANNFGTAEVLEAIATYQGKLAVISRRTTQIWVVDPDPANYDQVQILPNCGTPSPDSVKSVGDMDVYFLMDSGIRSIRVRDASSNAVLADIGVPIDSLVQPLIAQLTEDQLLAVCGVIEPSSNRYWVFIPDANGGEGVIYVYSYFPTSQIAAWSSYRPTYMAVDWDNPVTVVAATGLTQGYTGLVIGNTYYWQKGGEALSLTCGGKVLTASGYFEAKATTATETRTHNVVLLPADDGAIYPAPLTVFTPTKFAVYKGRVYARAGNNVFLYGGSDNASFDMCGVQADTPFLNAGTPATRKSFTGVDASFEGEWSVALGRKLSDPDDVKEIYANNESSFMRGLPLAARQGTHAKLRLVESGSGYARFASAIIHYQVNDEK